jgi:hypothetical protein
MLLLADMPEGYANSYQVEICLHIDGSVSVSCDYLPAGFPECTLFRHFPAFSDFLQVFPSRSMADLDDITPDKCRLLFETGHLSFHCVADLYRAEALLFTREKEGLHAIDQGSGQRHRVNFALSVPQDYLRYTRQYFANGQRGQHPGFFSHPPVS